MDAPDTIQPAQTQSAITDPQMDTHKVYEQKYESPQQVSSDQPIQLAQNDVPTYTVGSPAGLLEPGNIDLSNRPVVHNADGKVSTEYSTSFGDEKGREILVPTIVKGKFLTPDGTKPAEGSPEEKQMFKEAQLHYAATHEHMGIFSDARAADKYAQVVHNRNSKPTSDTHNIVQAPDGARVAFPKGTDPNEMHNEMEKWWQPHLQRTAAAWDSVKNAASNAAQALGLPSDMPEWQVQTDEFMLDPIGKTRDVVGAIIGGLAHGANAVIPSTPENNAMVKRAQAEYAKGNHLAAAVTLTPLIGDGLAKSVKQAQTRDYSGSLGTAVGVVAPFLIDSFKGEGELPITREKPVQPTTTSYEHTPDQSGQFGNFEHVVTTKNAEGKTVGHLAAQDTAPGEVTIRSNQIYDEAHRGQGKGTAAIRTLVNETAKNPSLKTIHSDITTTGAARGAWEKIADVNPDTVTKQDFNGVPRWSVDLDKVREKAANTPEFNGEERRGTARSAPMAATDLEQAMKNPGQRIQTPFDVTEGAMDTINRDIASRLEKPPVKAQTVGTAEGAANDTALFAKAKAALGPDASLSAIAKEAQRMKDNPEPQFTGNPKVTERGVKEAIKARSSLSQERAEREAAVQSNAPKAKAKPAPKKAPKDKATEFNPEDMSENIRPALSERMKNALS